MSKIHCKKCHTICNVRKSKKQDKTNPNIIIHGDLISHQDGTKEFKEYGRVNAKTEQIISMTL